ncbi:MAG: transcription-repair coupling factor [Nitrospinae bacterium]|nr:transcription-repair coupling factor [Nitrospinota bacterium]
MHDILQKFDNGERLCRIEGLRDSSSKAFFIARLCQTASKPLTIITAGQEEAEGLLSDINSFLNFQSSIYYFPPWETLPYEPISPHKDISGERLKVLSSVMESDGNFILVAPVESIIQRIIPKEVLRETILRFSVKDSLERDVISEYLITGGYKNSDIVEDKGEFSIRGGILDVYPPDSDNPFRIEFMGDEIESIREFDSATQRSVREVKEIKIVPARELIITEDRIQKSEVRSHNIKIITDRIKTGLSAPGIERLAPYFYENMDTLFDYVPSDAIVILDEPSYVHKKIKDFWQLIEKEYEQSVKRKELSPLPAKLYIPEDELKARLEAGITIQLAALSLSEETIPPLPPLLKGGMGGFDIKPVEQFKGNFDLFLEGINKWLGDGFRIIIITHTDGQAERLKEILSENELGAEIECGVRDAECGINSELQTPNSKLSIVVGRLSRGIIVSSERQVFITEEDIFGPSRKLKREKRAKRESFSVGLGDLKIGDYVVHVDYGIGQYIGTKDISADGVFEEFLDIEFADSEKLYIPMEKLKFIQKYTGSGSVTPPLDKLGGTSWAKTKERIKKSIREMARDLLKIYATREIVKGFAFTPDAHWHREFADSFEYVETEDQLQAIQDVIDDMEKDKPMDRLICGDVGYGKTEVAMRAAFKSVFDGRQVAFLVPTTILAQQHFQTFTDRFHLFPMKIDVLSRFKTKKEQEKIIKGLEEGSIDVVIGTHRMLQKDIKFKNIGLLIIDEEQRFGVTHKEKLKKLRECVDVLTLTATPIPRTLHMSLMGVRDLSVIETPPQNRLAIKTFVRQFGDEIIKQAIMREMEREGQTFFVHNRVESIYPMAKYLQGIIPNIRLGIIHGQMNERDMEDVMLRFINKEYDVLLCTTIIESGLDIPAANTIIINRADKLGLAQLYQLRGRVGRERHQAYAYLLIPGEDVLSETARKRLLAIEELSDLGAGFKLAARDMEIRGTGNILGDAQSGHISAVGFDLYCKLMEETVKELKGEPPEESIEPSMKLSMKGYIPKEYISDLNQRLDIYKRIDMLERVEDVGRLKDELLDRYGSMPEPVDVLLSTVELKILSKNLKIEKVDMSGDIITLTFNKGTPISAERIMEFVKKDKRRIRFLSEDTIQLSISNGNWRKRYADIKNNLQIFSTAC